MDLSAADIDVEDLEDLSLLADIRLIIAVDDDHVGTSFTEMNRRGESCHTETGDQDRQPVQ